jgi:hypothetical protein
VDFLAGLYVIPKQQLKSVQVTATWIDVRDLSTVEEIWIVTECGAVVSRIGKVYNRRTDAIHECNRDNLAIGSVSAGHRHENALTLMLVSENKQSFSCHLCPELLSL